MAKEVSPGGLVPSVERAAHRWPRTPDCLLGAEALLALSQEQACGRPHRQQLSGVSYQPSRRDQVTGVPEGSLGTMDLGTSSVGLLEGDAPTRQSKLCGRLPPMPEATPWGLEAAPAGSADDLGYVRGGPGKSVRLRMHNSPSPMVLLGRDQCYAWDRRSRQHLAEGSPLCIPSDPPDNVHISQGEFVRPQGTPSSPQVASEYIFLCTPQSGGRRTGQLPVRMDLLS